MKNLPHLHFLFGNDLAFPVFVGRGPVLDTGFQLTCLRFYGSGQQYRDNPQNGHACPAAQVKVMDQFIGLVK